MFKKVKIVHWIFILLSLCVILRLMWVMLPITETAKNAARLESRIFQSDTVISRRGSILARDGEPLATSILRYRIDFDMGSEGFDDEAALCVLQGPHPCRVSPPDARRAQETLQVGIFARLAR